MWDGIVKLVMQEGVEGGGVSNIIIKVENPEVYIVSSNVEKLEGRMGDEVIVSSHLKCRRACGVVVLEFADIHGDFGVSAGREMWVQTKPGRVCSPSQHISTMGV